MGNRKLKKPVIYAGYVISIAVIIGLVYTIESAISKSIFKPNDDDFKYVTKTILEDDIPVVGQSDVIIRPYHDTEVKVIKGYYDYLADAANQEGALIFHADTYFQNSGVAYGGKDNFEVLSILDGTIIDVKEDPLLGKIVEIRNSNDMISVYQSLSEVIVKKDDQVKKGDIIGKSGTSAFGSNLNDHLHFELIYKGQNVNPEEYYDKNIKDL